MSDEARRLMREAWAARRAAFDESGDDREASYRAAREQLIRAVALCRDGDDPVLLAQGLHLHANLEHDLGRHDTAMTLWIEAVSILREADAPLELAHKMRHVGDLHRHLGRLDDADTWYAQAAALYRDHDAPGSLHFANAIRPMAIVKERLGDRPAAAALWREAGSLYAAVDLDGLDSASVAEECSRHAERLEAS